MTCTLCPQRHYSRGWCRTHYDRWRRTGDPEMLRPPGPKPVPQTGDRFCYRCNEEWPREPATDAEGNPVKFWNRWSGVCRACDLERHRELMQRRRAA